MTWRAGVPLGVALALGCAPKLQRFEADPRPVCNGSETTVSWAFSGTFLASARLTTNLAGATLEKVPMAGSRTFVVKDFLTVTLVASRLGSSKRDSLEISTFPRDTTRMVPFKLDTAVVDSVEARDTLVWDPRYRLGAVANVSAWPVRVTHEGVTSVLTDSSETAAFAGQSGRGVWWSRMPLAATLSATPGAKRPKQVHLRIRMTCDSTKAAP